MATRSFISLRQLASSWNDAILTASDGDSFLDRVGISFYELTESDDTTVVSLTVEFDGEIGFSVPGMDGMGAYLGRADGSTSLEVEVELRGEGGLDGFEVRLPAVGAILRFASLLRPVREEDGAWVVETDANGAALPFELGITAASVSIDSDGDIDIALPDGAPFVSLPPVMLADAGVVIEADQIAFYFSSQATLPPAAPAGFKGLYLDSARVYLPAELKDLIADEVQFTNCYIGSGGFTGSVSFSGSKTATLFGFAFTLISVELSFVQNAIVKGAINGKLTIPFFDKEVNVALSLSSDGGFGITLADADADGLIPLTLEGIGTLGLTSLAVVVEDGEATLSLSGTLSLTIADLDWPDVEIQNLRISSDGEVQIDAGWLDLQEPLSLDLYGFRMEISGAGFGNEPAQAGAPARRWIGFSGGIGFPDPVSVAANAEGLRVSWEPANPSAPPEITLDGLGLGFTIPGVLTLAGAVSLVDEGGTHLFRGSAQVELLPLAISLDASLMIGEQTDESGLTYKVLYVYLSVEQRVGIPILATGAAVYGFAGLFGSNVTPNREGSDWYSWYATQDPGFNLTEPAKWTGQVDAVAVGTGVTVGSFFDGGWALSAKGLLVVLIPGPVIMVEAKANILSVPPGLTDTSEGTFGALAVLDAAAGYFQLNIDASLDVRKIIDVSATAEAYAEVADASAAHLYIGEEPNDRRIRADLLSLFSADAYYMLEPGGIRTGFGVSLGDSWKFGPVRLTLEAWLEADAQVSWRPPQLAASIGLGGQFLVSVANFDCGISAEAALNAKAAAPFLVEGSVTIRVNLPWPCDDLDFTFSLSWEKDDTPPMETPLESVSAEHLKVSETWPLALTESDLSPGGAPDPPLVPLDAKLVLVFHRLVDTPTALGLATLPPNTPIEIGDYTFSYELVSVKLERCSKFYGDAWAEVAMDPDQSSWAAIDDGTGSSSKICLYLGVATPFAFNRFSSRSCADSFLERHPGWPCIDQVPAPEICAAWEAEDVGEYGPFFTEDSFTFVSPARVVRTVDDYGSGSFIVLQLDPISDVDVAAEPLVLCIAPPSPAARIRLRFLLVIGETTISCYSKGELTAEVTLPDLFDDYFEDYLAGGGTIENPQAMYAGEFEIEGESIDWIRIETSLTSGETVFKNSEGVVEGSVPYAATLKLISVCVVSRSAEDAALAQQERLESLESSATAWSTTDPVFEAESYYRLAIQTRTVREKNGNEEDEPYTHYVYFQTGGPPGILPLAPSTDDSAAEADAAAIYPTGGALADLSRYVRWTIPSDGVPDVYRAYDLGIEFNENYVERMFGADMGIRLLDRNARPLSDTDGNEILLENQWGQSATTQLSTMEVAYVAAYENCRLTSEIPFIADQTISSATSALLLDEFDTVTGFWTAVDEGTTGASSWTITSGHLMQLGTVHDGTTTDPSPAERLGTLYVAGDQRWSDYAFEVDVTSDDAAVGVVFRYTETDGSISYYRLGLDRHWGYRRLVRMRAGVATVLWERTSYSATASGVAPPMASEAYEPGQKFTLAVQCQGRRLRGQLNGELLFDLEDSADAALLQGCIALYTWNNSSAIFERTLVRTWPGALLDPLTQYTAELLGSHVLFDEALAPSWSTDSLQPTGIGNAALVGESWWTDYRLVTNLQIGDDVGGVVVRYDASGDHCRFAVDTDGSWKLVLHSSGNDRLLGSGQLDSVSGTVTVSLECVGDTVELQIAGLVAYTGAVADLPACGTAGLFSEGTDTPHSDLMILSAPRRAVRSWTLISSAFANFVDHMDSFDGTIYDAAPAALSADSLTVLVEDLIPAARAELARLADDLATTRQDLEAAPETDQEAKRTVVQSAIDALHRKSWQTYDELFALLFGDDAYRPLPPVVEISEIVSDGTRLGLLLESPQPIVWSRIDWELRRLAAASSFLVDDLLLCWSEDQTRALLLADGVGGLADDSYELRMIFHLDRGLEGAVLRSGGSTLAEAVALSFDLV